MTSITINLTLEQVLEFIQNLPLEYKQAVKQKLESEKVEKINQNELDYISENSDIELSSQPILNPIESISQNIEQPKKSILDEIAGIIKDDNLPDYKTLRDAAIIENYKQKS